MHSKTIALIAALVGGMSSTAHAQQYQPITLSQAEYQQMMNILQELPFKDAFPLISILNNKETQAQQEAASKQTKGK